MNSSSFALGVGGHQNLGDEETEHFVAQQFRSLLTTYQQREPHLHLYSALARGTDQLFVQIACDLHIPVEIVIPCDAYEQIFAKAADRQDYMRLLHTARTVHQLPVQQCSDDAFLAAEQWIIEMHPDKLLGEGFVIVTIPFRHAHRKSQYHRCFPKSNDIHLYMCVIFLQTDGSFLLYCLLKR